LVKKRGKISPLGASSRRDTVNYRYQRREKYQGLWYQGGGWGSRTPRGREFDDTARRYPRGGGEQGYVSPFNKTFCEGDGEERNI